VQEYRVGTIYHPGKTRWQEGTDFNYRSGCLELRMFFSRLTQSDIRAIRNGPCSFHLAVVNDTLFFLFQFGNACPLSDSSYSWHLVAEDERTIPPTLSPGEMALLTIILVSSEDGIIRALRQISLSHNFSVALFDAIRAQIERPFSRAEHDKRIAETYVQYPTSQALLRRATATCIVEAKEGRN
jgi:hypothetical protein